MYKILVAGSETIERMALCKILSKNLGSGYTILEARNGAEAVAVFEREEPQILLMDVVMPGITGLEAARKIRSTGRPCVIVFLSAYDNFSYAREAISLRAMEYLLKPCSERELLTAVENALGLYERLRPGQGGTQERMLLGEGEEESARLSFIREHIECYIRENYASNLSMQKAAQAMNYSDTYFCRLFKQIFGVNFSTYLARFRVERARDLLSGTMHSVKEVGAACGYSDTSYFIRVFKRITGQTPAEYRIGASGEKNKIVP